MDLGLGKGLGYYVTGPSRYLEIGAGRWGAPVGDVTVAGRGDDGHDRRQRVRDGGDVGARWSRLANTNERVRDGGDVGARWSRLANTNDRVRDDGDVGARWSRMANTNDRVRDCGDVGACWNRLANTNDRVRDGGDRRRAPAARQRRQLSHRVAGRCRLHSTASASVSAAEMLDSGDQGPDLRNFLKDLRKVAGK